MSPPDRPTDREELPWLGDPSPRRRFRRGWLLVAAVFLVLVLGVTFGPLLQPLVTTGIRYEAGRRGYNATWASLQVRPPLRVRFRDLTVTRRATGDTLLRADSLAVTMHPWTLLVLRPQVSSLDAAHAAIRLRGSHAADPDTLVPEAASKRDHRDDPQRAARVRGMARSLVRLLVAPGRDLPRLALRDVMIATMPVAPPAAGAGTRRRSARAKRPEAPAPEGVRIVWLDMAARDRGISLTARGLLLGRTPMPFEAALDYGHDDRITGGARFEVPAADQRRPDTLRVAIDGTLHQDRGTGRATIGDSTRVTIGTLAFHLGGEAALAGPSFRFVLDAERLTAAQWKESLPRATLGPLRSLSVRGWYGYRVNLDLDLAKADSVRFDADVQPHGLSLDSTGLGASLRALDQPFVAQIHLPRDRIVLRDLSQDNPRFRPLPEIDSVLVHAVVTNEDGAFFRHGGFNLEAVRSSIADNLRAGAFRRGAGTITMQLVRNLYLGHDRTLSRKGQEVVLAWVLEHLTRITKERMLEIYLNIIEWGPDVHGADEASEYYFGHDAGRLTVDEALFLATIVPAPLRWRNRFDETGALRPFARAQMHFIGRAMIRKGHLQPEQLPEADALRVELRGAAEDTLDVSLTAPDPNPAPAATRADSTAS